MPISPADIRVTVTQELATRLGPEETRELVYAFKAHKCGVRVKTFGKDVPYDDPIVMAQNDVRHIHILSIEDMRRRRRSSDSALMYAVHAEVANYYLLVTIFEKGAHKLARDYTLMRNIAYVEIVPWQGRPAPDSTNAERGPS